MSLERRACSNLLSILLFFLIHLSTTLDLFVSNLTPALCTISLQNNNYDEENASDYLERDWETQEVTLVKNQMGKKLSSG